MREIEVSRVRARKPVMNEATTERGDYAIEVLGGRLWQMQLNAHESSCSLSLSVVNTEVAAQPGTHFSVMLSSTPSSLPVLRWGHITGFQQWNANGNDML